MTVKRTTFRRTFQSVKAPEGSQYSFIPSKEDNIWGDLVNLCMHNGNNFNWINEGNSANLTQIYLSDIGVGGSIGPQYERHISVQTMGLCYHPQGLLDVLERHGYTVAPPKTD